MAPYGPIYVEERAWVSFSLGEMTLDWGLGARLLSLSS